MKDSMPHYSAALREALGSRIVPEAQRFVDMFAEDGVMEFPYAPPGRPRRVEGRAALVAYLEALDAVLTVERIGAMTVHDMADPALVVLEFEGSGRILADGRPYEQRYVSIVETRDGHIVRYRDYWNPMAMSKPGADGDG